jgi:hypothetical protein
VVWVAFSRYNSTIGTCVYAFYYSLNNASSWTAMAEPGTQETTGFVGLGDQCTLFISLVLFVFWNYDLILIFC